MPNRKFDLSKPSPRNDPNAVLVWYFQRNGCVRVVDEERRQKLGQKYKKGYEVRLVANSEDELQEIQRLISKAGFWLAKPYRKRSQIVQPIYGKATVDWFLEQSDRKKKNG